MFVASFQIYRDAIQRQNHKKRKELSKYLWTGLCVEYVVMTKTGGVCSKKKKVSCQLARRNKNAYE